MKFRLKVAGIHFFISLIVALAGLYLVFGIWHPSPLAKAVGVTHIFLLLMLVDVCLGPLLTLIVASSPQKKTLKFDLLVISVLQIIAYVYGMHNIIISRPVYIAYDNVLFDVVQADTVIYKPDAKIAAQYQHKPWLSPQWIAVRPFRDAKEQNERTSDELQQDIKPSMRADLYQPIDNTIWKQISEKLYPLSNLKKYNAASDVDAVLQKYPKANGYIPLRAPSVNMAVLIDIKARQTLDIVDLRPD